jgi:hypothetical protein
LILRALRSPGTETVETGGSEIERGVPLMGPELRRRQAVEERFEPIFLDVVADHLVRAPRA